MPRSASLLSDWSYGSFRAYSEAKAWGTSNACMIVSVFCDLGATHVYDLVSASNLPSRRMVTSCGLSHEQGALPAGSRRPTTARISPGPPTRSSLIPTQIVPCSQRCRHGSYAAAASATLLASFATVAREHLVWSVIWL